MYDGLFPLLFTPNLISLLIWFIVIVFLVPHRPVFGLYLWLFLAFWTVFYFPVSRPYVNPGLADTFGEAVVYLITLPIAISILPWMIFIILNKIISPRYSKKEKLPELRLANVVILFLYSVLLCLWTFLFFTDVLKGYHSAWEAYIILTLFSLLFPSLLKLSTKYIRVKRYIQDRQIPWFIYSFCIANLSLLLFSFGFASTARTQTKKTIERYAKLDAKYCIQYMKIDTWLDLTPLTTWNKGSIYRGAGINHAILGRVVN